MSGRGGSGPPPASRPAGTTPSIRLNLPSKSSAPSQQQQATQQQQQQQQHQQAPPGGSTNDTSKPSKKRRFNTTAPAPSSTFVSAAADLQVLHQQSFLSLLFQRGTATDPNRTPSWHVRGQTTLYVIDHSLSSPSHDSRTAPPPQQRHVALHLRGSCRVEKVAVESIIMPTALPNATVPVQQFTSRPTKFQHLDPLTHVLVKPANSYTLEDDVLPSVKPRRYDADAQSTRGAAGMTNGLRATSIASNLGELRIAILFAPIKGFSTNNNSKDASHVAARRDAWKQDLMSSPSVQQRGIVFGRLQEELLQRSHERRAVRTNLISQTMAAEGDAAFKITVHYEIVMPFASLHHMHHMGGFHAVAHTTTPHVYTTCGVMGDHEGTRCWLPCLDSASSKHRASHEVCIMATAPMRDGLSVVGFGEDLGVSETLFHDRDILGEPNAVAELGPYHVPWIRGLLSSDASNNNHNHQRPPLPPQNPMHENQPDGAPHVIPPDTLQPHRIVSLDEILATHVWVSSSWTPLPARSLGFCVGPFKFLEDPEYFGMDQDDDSSNEEEADDLQQSRNARMAAIQSARRNGEGIRQVYFAPLYERKWIHVKSANRILLPHTELKLAPLTRRQREASKALQEIITASTVGVPHRALSLMREILALPSYRTSSYTQVWIPNAVHGGVSCGALHTCPEVLCNPFLGGAIMDSRLLPPVGYRLPFYQGGRVLQFIQARCAVRGWINAALPLGGNDDVGYGYLLTLVESFIMSLYERGHGGFGEGGAKNGVFYTKRFAGGSGLNSSSLDFLPVNNMEDGDLDLVAGSVPLDDRNNENHLRSAVNGTESHTSATDEFAVRHVLCKDFVDAVERVTDVDKFGWLGSQLSLSFLSSNSSSSSNLGCGAVELMHPLRGLVYRTVKTELFRKVVEARTDFAVFVRLIRAAFSAAHLVDIGEKEVHLPKSKKPTTSHSSDESLPPPVHADQASEPQPPFLLCVNELLKTKGLTHILFARALRLLAGRIREARLLGTLVDVDPSVLDPITKRPVVQPEGFPNSFVRGGSELYLRVGIHVEPSADKAGSQSVVSKGLQLQTYAEPVIPQGGIAYGGPVTYRVVENEGALREFVRNINSDGSRCDWGSIFLHAKPVSSAKSQTEASGAIDTAGKESGEGSEQKQSSSTKRLLGGTAADSVFTDSFIHGGGYQAIDLIRLTNLTPLLWVRVDPPGQYGGRISVFQPDACLAEQLFYDSDSGAQVDAVRALAERPVRIQGSVKVTTVYDVSVSELPARVLGDCLRGTATLHNVLPHTPAVRSQAALSIGQWQNNKAPSTKDAVGEGTWVGVKILIQYFHERYYSNGIILPAKFSRVAVKYNEPDVRDSGANNEMPPTSAKAAEEELFQYLDTLISNEEKAAALAAAEEVDVEEDEEYRVRSAVVTSLASVRAKDGMTPNVVREFLRSLLDSEDVTMVRNLITPDDDLALERHTYGKSASEQRKALIGDPSCSLAYLSSTLVADALLALCHVNVSPDSILDPATGKPVQSKASHPIIPLLDVAQRWLDWELYREKIRWDAELESQTGVGCVYQDTVAACAITALSSLAILRQSTTDTVGPDAAKPSDSVALKDDLSEQQEQTAADPSTALYYIAIFDGEPRHSDVIRAACAQAIACICCAADRFESESVPSIGLLTALEFMLARIQDPGTSPGLRQTLALLMMDACTGKIASMQRVGAIGGRNDLVVSGARFMNGPLGASHGGDNGSALLMTVNSIAHPAASAVNDGARRGLRLLTKAGHPRESVGEVTVVRVARFASDLWRTINGDCCEQTLVEGKATTLPNTIVNGVCSFDGILRVSLLSLWQWVWPKTCLAVLQVQAWKSHEGSQRYKDLGAHLVMKTTDEEQELSKAEEDCLADLNRLVAVELDRQRWRNEMAFKAYEYYKADKEGKTVIDLEQGVGYPLPPIQRDNAFKQGGWIASVAQQRRAMALDGGTAVTKLRLTVKNSGGDE